MGRHRARPLAASATLLAFIFFSGLARAQALEAPVDGKSIPLPDGAYACGSVTHGWTVSVDRRSVKPPASEAELGQEVEVAVSSEPSCTTANRRLTLVATGPWPVFDPQSIVVSDDGRIEGRGTRLRGVTMRWSSPSQSVRRDRLRHAASRASCGVATTAVRHRPGDRIRCVPASRARSKRSGSPDVIAANTASRRAALRHG